MRICYQMITEKLKSASTRNAPRNDQSIHQSVTFYSGRGNKQHLMVHWNANYKISLKWKCPQLRTEWVDRWRWNDIIRQCIADLNVINWKGSATDSCQF